MIERERFQYQPYYCEENAWWMCHAPELGDAERAVVFVSNPQRQVLLWHQRAVRPAEAVLWDYHVFVVSGMEVWDLDTRLALPSSVSDYLDATFADVPPEYPACLRVVPAALYVQRFTTDRGHMRAADGTWLNPPPPWPPPCAPEELPNLQRFIDMTDPWIGERLTLGEWRRRWRGSGLE